MIEFAIDDLVEVDDEGLAMLRQLCPDMPSNHHGRVYEIRDDSILVEFPINGSYDDHSQVAPYPISKIRKRVMKGETC